MGGCRNEYAVGANRSLALLLVFVFAAVLMLVVALLFVLMAVEAVALVRDVTAPVEHSQKQALNP